MVVPAVVVEPFLSGSLEALPAGLADRFSSSLVLVVGRDVADRLMQAHRVVLDPHAGELGFEHDRVVDVLEMGPLALDVTEQRLDPRLIRRRVRPAPVLGDGQQRHERPRVGGSHRRPVIRDRQQDRPGRVVDREVEALIGQQLEQAFELEGVLEEDLDLGGGGCP